MVNRRGFSAVELLIVIVIIGIMVAMVIPRIGRGIVRENIRSARVAVTNIHATARASAISRGTRTVLKRVGNKLFVLSTQPVTGAEDTVVKPQDLNERYGVTLTSSRDSLVFDPRGIGMETSSTYFYVTRSGVSDTIEITSAGSVVQ